MVLFGSRRRKKGAKAVAIHAEESRVEGISLEESLAEGFIVEELIAEDLNGGKPYEEADCEEDACAGEPVAEEPVAEESVAETSIAEAETTQDAESDGEGDAGASAPTPPNKTPPNKKPLGKALRGVMLYAYAPLAVAYLETILRLFCGYPFFQGFLFSMVVSVGVGFAINAVSLAFPNPKASRAIGASLVGLCCFVVGLQYFMYSTYGSFMGFDTIFTGIGDVAGEYMDIFLMTILKGIPIIFLFMLPLIAFLVISGKRLIPFASGSEMEWVRCVSVPAIAVTTAAFVCVIVLGVDADAKYAHDEFSFDASSHRLGILAGVGLEIRYGIFGNPHEDISFVIDNTPPVDTQPPDIEPPDIEPPDIPSPVAPPTGTPGVGNASDSSVVDDPPDSPPPPVEYGYNIIDFDFDALIASEGDPKIRAIHEYVNSLPASHQNEYTGIFEGKNLIIITAEAFSREVVDPVMTPTLYRLVHKGFYFSDYYQPTWGGSTSSGEYSILTGLVPTETLKSIQKTIGKNLSFTIGNKLMGLGYSSASYHNGSYTYYNRDKTHTNFGYETFTAMGNGMEKYTSSRWPTDEDMMRFSLPQFIDRQPFSLYYMTVSAHAPYMKGANNAARKNWDAFPKQYAAMPDPIRAYMASNLELEYALAYVVATLEERGIADDTVIVLSTDHFPYALKKSETWGTDKDYLSVLYGFKIANVADQDHSALIIWSGSLEGEHEALVREVSAPTHSLDILPTLCNLFGLSYDSRLLVGRDVFSDTEPLVLWVGRHWKTELGFFNATSRKFTPAPGAVIPDGYVEWVKTIVKNKISYSGSVLNNDYFDVLFDKDGVPRK